MEEKKKKREEPKDCYCGEEITLENPGVGINGIIYCKKCYAKRYLKKKL